MDIYKYFKELKELLKAHPVPVVGFLLILISITDISVAISIIDTSTLFPLTFSTSENLIKIGSLIFGVLMLIAGLFQVRKNLYAHRLGIIKMNLRRDHMQWLYDKLHNEKAFNTRELNYMGTSLRGLFAPTGQQGPMHDFVKIFTQNNKLDSMKVLLLNPNPQGNDKKQLDEVTKAQNKFGEGRNLSNDIKSSLNALGKIYINLQNEHRKKLKVKVANEIFYVEFNMSDNEMIATHYCCGGIGNESPVYFLRKTEGGPKDGLFNRYFEDFKIMWGNAFEVKFDVDGNWTIQQPNPNP